MTYTLIVSPSCWLFHYFYCPASYLPFLYHPNPAWIFSIKVIFKWFFTCAKKSYTLLLHYPLIWISWQIKKGKRFYFLGSSSRGIDSYNKGNHNEIFESQRPLFFFAYDFSFGINSKSMWRGAAFQRPKEIAFLTKMTAKHNICYTELHTISAGDEAELQ